MNFTSRDQVMAEQLDEESRRALQAAWRNLHRSGLDRLRRPGSEKKCLKKMSRKVGLGTLDSREGKSGGLPSGRQSQKYRLNPTRKAALCSCGVNPM
jgi:hypothetical protein